MADTVLDPKRVKMPHRRNLKTIPRIQVESWRLRNWQAAVRMLVDRGGVDGLNLSRALRETMDDWAEAVFEEHGEPEEHHLFKDKWSAYRKGVAEAEATPRPGASGGAGRGA